MLGVTKCSGCLFPELEAKLIIKNSHSSKFKFTCLMTWVVWVPTLIFRQQKRSLYFGWFGAAGTLTFLTSELPALLGKKWATLLSYDIQYQHMLFSTWPQLTDQEWQRIPDSTNKYKLQSQKKCFYSGAIIF